MDNSLWLGAFTGLLAVATVWLAIETHRMGKAVKDSITLEAQPYLAMTGLNIHFQRLATAPTVRLADSVRIGIVLLNPSKVPVGYSVRSLRVTIGGATLDNPRFATHGGAMFPSQTEIYWYGTISGINITTLPAQGVVEYEIEYGLLESPAGHTAKGRLVYTVYALSPIRYDWMYLEAPRYR
jgi:hypothetical protein